MGQIMENSADKLLYGVEMPRASSFSTVDHGPSPHFTAICSLRSLNPLSYFPP